MKKDKSNGFTLIETVLALALGALILASLANVVHTGTQSWGRGTRKAELLQAARFIMARITSELRYTTQLDLVFTDVLEFDTNNLLDGNELTIETIRYERVGGTGRIGRSVNGGAIEDLVGGSGEQLSSVTFDNIPYKLDVSGNLVELNIPMGDTLSMAVAVEVIMVVSNPAGNIQLNSMVKLRNI